MREEKGVQTVEKEGQGSLEKVEGTIEEARKQEKKRQRWTVGAFAS